MFRGIGYFLVPYVRFEVHNF